MSENTDDNIIQPPPVIPQALRENRHLKNDFIQAKARSIGSIADSAKSGALSVVSAVGDEVKSAISSVADAARTSIFVLAASARLLRTKRADDLNRLVENVAGSGDNVNTFKAGINSLANINAEGFEYPAHATSSLINAAEVSALKGPSKGFEQLKKDFVGDIHRLSNDTLDWVGTNKDTIKQAQEAFGLNSDGSKNMNDETLLSTVLAISEELNRRGNSINNFFDWLQDGIISLTGRVETGGFLSPHIGAGNINVPTAENLATRFNDFPNPSHPDMQELKRKILGTEAELSRYILTEKGTIMVGAAIMYLIQQDIKNDHFFAAHQTNTGEFNVDIIQNLVDTWREGPNRIGRMRKNQQTAKKNNQAYEARHKHDDSSISDENVTDVKRILFPSTNEYSQ